jgi:threonine dehydratase
MFNRLMNKSSIQDASDGIRHLVKWTPCLISHELSRLFGGHVYLKMENLQTTGAFKIRGNANKLRNLNNEPLKNVVTASSGNHGLGLAYVADKGGIAATVVVPTRTPEVKKRRLMSYGAQVVVHGETYDVSVKEAKTIAQREGALYIPSFDDMDIITGNATLGLEILRDVPKVAAVICPIGGGGCAAGVGLALRSLGSGARLIGVEVAGAASMAESIQQGRRVRLECLDTLADGVAVQEPGELTFELVRSLLDDVIIVTEEELYRWAAFLMLEAKVVCELAGALSVAAMAKLNSVGNLRQNGSIVCLVSGGNIDSNLIQNLLGRYALASRQ